MRLRFIASIIALAPLLLAASQPVRLQASSRWVMDYAESSCRLSRSFGEGDNETVLLFEAVSPSEMDMVVVGRPLRTGADEVSAHFLPVQSHRIKGRMVESADKGRPAAIYSDVWLIPDSIAAKYDARREAIRAHPRARPPAISLAEQGVEKEGRQQFAGAVNELELETRRGNSVILETGSMAAPLKALDDCSRKSLRDWGVDSDLDDKIVIPPWPINPNRWFRPEDYPTKALNDGMQSDIRARVLVDATGRVTKCTSLSHFKLPEFNKLVCDSITKSAKFFPAELTDGTKVPSYYVVRVNYRIG